MDTVYPQPIRLRLGAKSQRSRGSQNRYRTQPITFSEIKEVDEENTDEEEPDVNRRMSAESGSVMSSQSSSNVNAKFEELFLNKRTDRKMNRRLQIRLGLDKKSTISSIPGSPENGRKNTEAVTSSTGVLSIIPKNVHNIVTSDSNQNSS